MFRSECNVLAEMFCQRQQILRQIEFSLVGEDVLIHRKYVALCLDIVCQSRTTFVSLPCRLSPGTDCVTGSDELGGLGRCRPGGWFDASWVSYIKATFTTCDRVYMKYFSSGATLIKVQLNPMNAFY